MDLLYIVLVFAILSCLCHAALWSPAWKELTSSSVSDIFCVYVTFR